MGSPPLCSDRAKSAVIYDAIVARNTDISSPGGGLSFVIELASKGSQCWSFTAEGTSPVWRCRTTDLAWSSSRGTPSMPPLLTEEV